MTNHSSAVRPEEKEPQAAVDGKPFGEADRKFEDIKARLAGEEVSSMRHSDVEELLACEGRELLRVLFQGHLDLRGPGEIEGSVTGSDGVVRLPGRENERNLQTRFGTVVVCRRACSAKGVGSLYPLDASLNLPPEKYSHGVQRMVGEEIHKQSFDETVKVVARHTGERVEKRQVEELTVRAAQDFDAFYEERAATPAEGVVNTADIIALTFDGKGVPMHPEALRKRTRKAAKKAAAKKAGAKPFSLGRPRAADERRDRKRMATVAAVYTTQAFFRTPEDVVRELNHLQVVEPDGAVRKRPRPEKKRVWASLKKTPEEVIAEAFEEGLHRDPECKKLWAALVDGNDTQLNAIVSQAAERRITLTIIVDLIHVAGYVWKAAHAFHPRGSQEAESWVRERLLEILRGRSSHVAAGMRRSATLRNFSENEREPVDDCADYLLKYRDFLHYDEYLAAGLPIATGVIEGACRYLVKDRMEITGATWKLERSEAVLKIRALHASGDFDEYWRFHIAQEFKRNHASRYAGEQPPELRTTTRCGNLRLVV